MLAQEEIEQRYFEVYQEKATFDEIKRKGNYLVASMKGDAERFFQGAGKIKKERNSMTYYVMDTRDGRSMKMVVSSQCTVDSHDDSVTSVKVYDGSQIKGEFCMGGVYINASDKDHLSNLLSGAFLDATLFAPLPKGKEKLFADWYHCSDENSVLEEKYKKYRVAELSEIKKNMRLARRFFKSFVGSEDDLKKSHVRASMMEKLHRFRVRMSMRKKSHMKLVFDHYQSHNRF